MHDSCACAVPAAMIAIKQRSPYFKPITRLFVILLFTFFTAACSAQQPPPVDVKASPAAHGDAAHDDAAHGEADHGAGHASLGETLPLWTILPFATLLLCIAVLPLASPHWWEHNSNKAIVAGILATIIVVYAFAAYGAAGGSALRHVLLEYVSFITLLGALYIISGGVYVGGSLNGTPLANTGILALGAVIANLVGTTGASVLLIRPLLRANRTRVNKAHVVIFFIFTVSNCGGLLTPIGDPPLFMGFMAGVPFEWTTINLWKQWMTVNGILLITFNIWDTIVFNKEEKERPGSQLEEVMKHEPLRIHGGLNFVYLAGVVAAVVCQGTLKWSWGMQEAIMACMALGAYYTTAPANRENNKFTFGPIIEVAVLFIGIFITMTPALQILNAWGAGHRPDLGHLALTQPWQFFWVSGTFSSVLDNAPTYIAMAATAAGMEGIAATEASYLYKFLKTPDGPALLAAISCGSVFMGANTYIGNGPNFMVKAIAEENDVKMPSFFGYMLYSGGILIPIFVVITFLFFR